MNAALLNQIRTQRIDWIKRDLEPEIINKISELAITAIEGFDSFKEMAHFLKAELDENISWGWNVVVGKKFSGLFVHRRGNLASFKIGETYFLMFNARKVRHVGR